MQRNLITTLISWALLATPALAQSPEDAILEGDTNVGLIEKKPAEKPVLDDPDTKLIESLNKRREAMEQFINEYQENFTKQRELEIKLAKKLKKISDAFDKLTADTLAAGDKFAVEHNPALARYREAIAGDKGPEVDKAAKEVGKHRAKYGKILDKLEKRRDRVKADFDKIAPQLDPPEDKDEE